MLYTYNMFLEVNIKLKDELITFKGVKEGIYINIEGNNFLEIKEELNKKLSKSMEFYKGSKLLGIKANDLSQEELQELSCILKYKYDLIVLKEELPSHILDDKDIKDEEDIIFEGIEEGMTSFIKGTLRSGQIVSYDGNIVIIGDVNPGALIEAGGNIIILGTLRGVAHAGKGGNSNSIVASYNFNPTQLRIANKIARSPDQGIGDSKIPEIAKIKNGEVVIEPYLPNK